MNIVAMSDLHGNLISDVEQCDIVCISGDIVPLKMQRNIPQSRKWFNTTFLQWANNLPCEKVFFIGGNHDFYLYQLGFTSTDKVIYLQDSSYDYIDSEGKTYKIYGTPWCKIFGNWAFMLSDEGLKEKYENIPNDVDVLLSHDAPYGCSDICLEATWITENLHLGNVPLLNIIKEKQPKYVIKGHLHTTTRELCNIGNSVVVSASILNERYEYVYKPVILKI
jgi:Icc-related predicted phosphoesterase